MNERTARLLLRALWRVGIAAASYKKVEVYFLVGSHSFPSGCCGQKKAPPSPGPAPHKWVYLRNIWECIMGTLPPPQKKTQLFQSLVFFWREERTASFSFDPVFVLMYIQFCLLFTQRTVCYLFLELVKELDRLNLYRWKSDDMFNKIPRVVFWTTQYYNISNDTKRIYN